MHWINSRSIVQGYVCFKSSYTKSGYCVHLNFSNTLILFINFRNAMLKMTSIKNMHIANKLDIAFLCTSLAIESQSKLTNITMKHKSQWVASGHSNSTTSRIAATRGRFAVIRQVAPMYTPPNTCFLGPTRVLKPNSIFIGSAVSAGLTTATDRQTTLLGL